MPFVFTSLFHVKDVFHFAFGFPSKPFRSNGTVPRSIESEHKIHGSIAMISNPYKISLLCMLSDTLTEYHHRMKKDAKHWDWRHNNFVAISLMAFDCYNVFINDANINIK